MYSRTLNAAERLRSSLPTSPGEAVVLYSNETSDNFGKLIENTEIDAVIIAYALFLVKTGKLLLLKLTLLKFAHPASGKVRPSCAESRQTRSV